MNKPELIKPNRPLDDKASYVSETVNYWSNGSISSRSFFNEHGNIIRSQQWNENGILRKDCEFLNGLKNGLELIYSEKTGNLISKCGYVQDKFNGWCEFFEESSAEYYLRKKYFYLNGIQQGDYSIFHKDGSLEEKGSMRDGKYDGERIQFGPSGKPSCIMRYLNGKLHGCLEDFHEDGTLQRCSPHKEGKKHGIEKSYNQSAQLISRTCYIEGSDSGDFGKFEENNEPEVIEIFHHNGALKERLTYLNGIANGAYEFFNEEGKNSERGNYKAGKKHGEVILYFPNEDKIQFKKSYTDGVLNGITTEYYISGKIKITSDYENDVQKEIIAYFENENICYKKNFINGTFIEFYATGKARREASFSTDMLGTSEKLEGVEKGYFSSGILMYNFEWKKGFRHGKTINYDSSGLPASELDYSENILKHAIYFENGSKYCEQTFQEDSSWNENYFDEKGTLYFSRLYNTDDSIKEEIDYRTPENYTIN